MTTLCHSHSHSGFFHAKGWQFECRQGKYHVFLTLFRHANPKISKNNPRCSNLKKQRVLHGRSSHGSSIKYFLRIEKQQQKSCKDRNLWHRWHHLLQHIAMFVFSSLDSPWEPSLLEEIHMDVRGHNMERKSFSRIKMKEFAFHTHLRANLVLAQCWSNIFQTYNASTALEGMVKHKVRLTNSFQAGCQMMPEVSIYRRNVPGIFRELHGIQPSIGSPSAVDCAEVGCWLLPVSYLAATLVHATIEWFDSILACFRSAQECQSIEATAPSPAACSCARSRKALRLWGQKKRFEATATTAGV